MAQGIVITRSSVTPGVLSITGTADQVIASATTGSVTLSLPQSLATTSSPTFSQLTVSNDPVNISDVATKSYVDAAAVGFLIQPACTVFADSTNTQITGATYTAGTTGADGGTGVGATLVGAANGALVVDGYTLLANERVLVNAFSNSAATATQNGIYTVTATGSGTTPFTLTRSTDYNNGSSVQITPGDYTFITKGTTYVATGWVETDIGSLATPTHGIVIGTDKIYFTQFSGAGTYLAGTGLTLTGSTFSLQTPVALANGGTGTVISAPPTNGQLLIGNGTAFTLAALATGPGIGVTNGAGSITVANTGILTIQGTTNQISVLVASGDATVSIANDPVLPGTGAVTIPSGTTAQRPATPSPAMLRYNSDLGYSERYSSTSSAWVPFGRVLQFFSANITTVTGTTAIPYGNTAPTTADGSLVWSQSITPKSTSSRISINFSGMCDVGQNNRAVIITIFRNAVLVGVQVSWILTSGKPAAFACQFVDTPATTSPVTYSAYAGTNAAGAVWYIGEASNATFGGANCAAWSIAEIV